MCRQVKIRSYDDFVAALLAAGFSMGGGNSENVHSVIPWNWNEEPPYETPVRWHTGDPETDPWEWRMRVLDERNDIAYGKIFFKKSGFITKQWYPYFLAARRGTMSFEDKYLDGLFSRDAKRIYDCINEHGSLPFHAIKVLAGFGKEDKSSFERALVELQMKLYITICGRQQRMSQAGLEYGWSSTVFCTTESFFGDEVFQEAAQITEDEAVNAVSEQILTLNPNADPKKIFKFLKG